MFCKSESLHKLVIAYKILWWNLYNKLIDKKKKLVMKIKKLEQPIFNDFPSFKYRMYDWEELPSFNLKYKLKHISNSIYFFL